MTKIGTHNIMIAPHTQKVIDFLKENNLALVPTLSTRSKFKISIINFVFKILKVYPDVSVVDLSKK